MCSGTQFKQRLDIVTLLDTSRMGHLGLITAKGLFSHPLIFTAYQCSQAQLSSSFPYAFVIFIISWKKSGNPCSEEERKKGFQLYRELEKKWGEEELQWWDRNCLSTSSFSKDSEAFYRLDTDHSSENQNAAISWAEARWLWSLSWRTPQCVWWILPQTAAHQGRAEQAGLQPTDGSESQKPASVKSATARAC